ncbi:hypothetical protein F5890DRAFT_1478804, partial [Lentinula detonsa]
LEKLHSAWTSRQKNPELSRFHPALDAALAVIEEYYELTVDSEAYLIAMVLDPALKLSYFKKNWSIALQQAVTKNIQSAFTKCFEKIKVKSPRSDPSPKPKATQKLQSLFDDGSDDEFSLSGPSGHGLNVEPWEAEYNRWMNAPLETTGQMNLIEWWGADEEEEEKFSEKVCTKDDSFVLEVELDSDAEE